MNFRGPEGKVLRAELCPSKIHVLKSWPPVPHKVTVFEDRTFKEVIKVRPLE